MGDFLRALLSIRSTQWLKAIGPSADSARSATLVADRFAYLLPSVLSRESPDKVIPQTNQSRVEDAGDTSCESLQSPLRWPQWQRS